MKADQVEITRSKENNIVVSSMGFLLCPIYSRLGVKEAGNLEIPIGPDPPKNQTNKTNSCSPSQVIRKETIQTKSCYTQTNTIKQNKTELWRQHHQQRSSGEPRLPPLPNCNKVPHTPHHSGVREGHLGVGPYQVIMRPPSAWCQ